MRDEKKERALLKLALEALERPEPNVLLAMGALRDVIGASASVADAAPATAARAVTVAEAASALGYSPKTVRARVKSGLIPSIGAGRATRVLLDEAITSLRSCPRGGRGVASEPADPIEAAARAWATRDGSAS